MTTCDRDSREFCGKADISSASPKFARPVLLLTVPVLALFLFQGSSLALVVVALAMHRLSSASTSAVRRSAAKAAKPVLKRGAHKEIKFSNEGRASILNGVDVLANAVSVTLGPKGAYLVYEKMRGGDATDTSIDSQVATSSSSSPLVGPRSPRVSIFDPYPSSLFRVSRGMRFRCCKPEDKMFTDSFAGEVG